jgi:hypothetical protein
LPKLDICLSAPRSAMENARLVSRVDLRDPGYRGTYTHAKVAFDIANCYAPFGFAFRIDVSTVRHADGIRTC